MGPMENTPLSCLFKSENESERKKTRTMGGGVLCTSGTLKKFFCISDALTFWSLIDPGKTDSQGQPIPTESKGLICWYTFYM